MVWIITQLRFESSCLQGPGVDRGAPRLLGCQIHVFSRVASLTEMDDPLGGTYSSMLIYERSCSFLKNLPDCSEYFRRNWVAHL